MNKNLSLIIGILTAIIFLIIYNLSSFAYGCENVRSDTIRLHIIANSDSSEDQKIKILVRDMLLNDSEEYFPENITTKNAVEILNPNLKKIKKETDELLHKYGFKYNSEVTLETEYFDTRIYENGITMPAGKYLALKIRLGEGEGKNWWCIMFPTLCIPVAQDKTVTVYSESEKAIISSDNNYKIRFKIIEYIEKIKNKVDNVALCDNA